MKGKYSMRKWLIILVVILAAVLGVLWWLGSSLDEHKPDAGETRMEIEHVL